MNKETLNKYIKMIRVTMMDKMEPKCRHSILNLREDYYRESFFPPLFLLLSVTEDIKAAGIGGKRNIYNLIYSFCIVICA